MATERACSLLPDTSPYAEDLRHAMHKAKRQWHWRRPWVQDSNLLYQCPKKAPDSKHLQKYMYVKIEKLKCSKLCTILVVIIVKISFICSFLF